MTSYSIEFIAVWQLKFFLFLIFYFLSHVGDSKLLAFQNSSRAGSVPLTRSDSMAFPASFEGLWDTLSTFFELFTFAHAADFVKENLGIFVSVLESVWLLLKSNVSLCLSILSAIFSIILGGGTAVLNFVLSTVSFVGMDEENGRFLNKYST